jgi:hypothetical protein
MKILFLCALLVLSNHCLGKTYTMKLTFIDAYTNSEIIGDSVVLESVNVGFGKKFITDNYGSICFEFKPKNYIDVMEYDFYFLSDKYLGQTRDRYLTDTRFIEITFFVYPNEEYESKIWEIENNILSGMHVKQENINCIQENFKDRNDLNESFIDENLQTPSHIGDYGYLAKFKVTFKLTNKGKPFQIEILESTHKELNEEIKRLIRLLPEWSDQKCQENEYSQIETNIIIDHQL